MPKVTQPGSGQVGLAAQKAWLCAHGLVPQAPLPAQGHTALTARVPIMAVIREPRAQSPPHLGLGLPTRQNLSLYSFPAPLLSPPGQPLTLITLWRSQESTHSPISGIRYCLDNCLLLFLSCSRAETPHHLLWTEQWPSQIHLLISYHQCNCIWR